MRPDENFHTSVLLKEVLEALLPRAGKTIVDGTLGGGGHSETLLEWGAEVIGLDQDEEALDFTKERLRRFGTRFRPARANFGNLGTVLEKLGTPQVDGVLLDLGVSSWQLDTAERGFSFQREGPLDMRMNRDAGMTAADLVNTASPEELTRIFREYGEEPNARRIASRLVSARVERKFETTMQLALAVESVVPRRRRIHPATRIFQALRIAVNRELEMLESVLGQAAAALRPEGRMAVITFHSLEDRIVKDFFKLRAAAELDRPEWPAPRPNPDHIFKAVTRKPVVASEAEQERNPRARSAKLRVVEKIEKKETK
jgi:16S rRNA (cytosine1402-N4)-methyltransferase